MYQGNPGRDPALGEMEAMASTLHIAEAGVWKVEETEILASCIVWAVVEPKRGQLQTYIMS